MLKCLFTSAVLVLFAGQANAEIITGNDLVEYMREQDKHNMGHPNPEYFSVGFYSGFVAGAFDAYDSAGMLCYTDQVALGQAEAIVSRYLKANPDKWNLPAVDLIQDALQSAFPCAK
jgi:Rap1a immunity proteins